MYDVAIAFLGREAEKPGEVQQHADRILDQINPPPKVEQTRNEHGVLEHNPDMTFDGWGFTDPTEMDMGQGSASAMYGPASE